MIRIIRTLIVVAGLASVAGAQVRPTPPTPPAPTAPVAKPAPRSAPAPKAPIAISLDALRDLDIDLSGLRLESLNADLARVSREASRIATREAIDATREATREALEASRAAMEDMRLRGNLSLTAPVALSPRISDGPRYQSDPADSLYQRALALLNNSDYRAAAQRFKEVQQRYPQTQYMARAMYYQAFALNRAGSDVELREALTVLEALQQKFPNTRVNDTWGSGISDAPTLAMRVRGNLAQRGDATARQQLNQATAGGAPACDQEDQLVRSAALSALMQVDPAAAMPKVEQILAKRDECSTRLRQNALQIITQRGDEKSVPTLLATAKQDPSASVRQAALEFVSRFPSDEVTATFESMARSEQNDRVRRTAAQMLVGNQSPRARQAVRSIIENDTIPDNVRADMLSRFDENRGTTDDAVWMRAAYPKVTSPNVKMGIVRAVGRIGGTDSQKWLTDLAGSDQESAQIRAEAFRRVSTNMTIADLSRAYDAAGSRAMRRSIVSTLNQRKESEAVDKMIEIARKSTDPDTKQYVISLLTERKDPKITALLIELIDR